MSLEVGYKDLLCKTVHCTPLQWSHRAAAVTVPCTSLGGPILIKNIEPRILPKFPILILKLLHPIDRNEASLESMAPLLEILEVVDMTMIDDVNGDGDTMVCNTKKGGSGEGEEKGGVHPSTLVPGGEGVALLIGMPGPWRLGVEGVEGGGVLPMPPLHLLGLALPFPPTGSQVPRDLNPRRAIRHLPFPQIQTHPPIRSPTAFFNVLHDNAGICVMELQHNSLQVRVVVKQRQQRVSEAVGLGNAELRYLHQGHRGVQGRPSTILKRSPRHGACAVKAVHTSVHCAESYVIGPLLQQGIGMQRSRARCGTPPIWGVVNMVGTRNFTCYMGAL